MNVLEFLGFFGASVGAALTASVLGYKYRHHLMRVRIEPARSAEPKRASVDEEAAVEEKSGGLSALDKFVGNNCLENESTRRAVKRALKQLSDHELAKLRDRTNTEASQGAYRKIYTDLDRLWDLTRHESNSRAISSATTLAGQLLRDAMTASIDERRQVAGAQESSAGGPADDPGREEFKGELFQRPNRGSP